MKKLSIFFAFLVAMCSLSSCVDDREPIYQDPTAFQLNTPALADHLYQLSEDGTMEISWSQPDYGYSAIVKYTVDIALTEDFAKFESLDASYTTCVANLKEGDMAIAICKLQGYSKDNADSYNEPDPHALYIRVNAEIEGVETSKITSNVIKLNKVKGYKAIQAPGFIYLVGQPEGWAGPNASAAEHYEDWKLFEADDAIGSKIYTGVFNIKAGEAMFRFYSALTGWDQDSYGSQEADSPVDIALDNDGLFAGNIVKGKGSFNIPNWEGGSLKITVDLNAMKVKFEKGGIDVTGKKFIYLVGAPEGWAGPDEANKAHYDDWKLYDMEDNGIYTWTFNIEAGKFQFRFYKALTGWDGGDSMGSQEEDAPVELEWEDGVSMSGLSIPGKGSWADPTWNGGKVQITVNTVDELVSFTRL